MAGYSGCKYLRKGIPELQNTLLILAIFVFTITFQTFGFIKGLAAFLYRKIDQAQRAEAVYKSKTI